ncbi:MAG: hypothetical protein KAK00_03730 [Nanoarchaeota archaeon]|nr:hypothetical protein [Nanoarchaeota archaeon]
MRIKKTISALFLFLLLISTAIDVSASGIGVNPAKLVFELNAGQALSRTLYVINKGKITRDYKVYVDDIMHVSINPETFTLKPEEYRPVEIEVSPKNSLEHNTKISVVTADSDNQLGVGVGIKVPLIINFLETKSKTPPIFGYVVREVGEFSIVHAMHTLLAVLMITASVLAFLLVKKKGNKKRRV